jgi:thiamine biosynthesis lipoprotein
MQRRTVWLIFAVVLLAALGFWRQWQVLQPDALTLRGETMGTTYSVRIAGRPALSAERLQALLTERLGQVNASMSTWDPRSEISRINAAPADTPLRLGADLRIVLAAALALSRATDGAFDPTVGPLVNLWGFGPDRGSGEPLPGAVAEIQRRIGYRHAELEGDVLTKTREGLQLDLSAIAKGFGVDALARVLEANGIRDYVVEIGGDLVVRGHNPQGQPWGIGIERPDEAAPPGEALQAVVRLEAGALATSGTYRRFKRAQGGVRHHIIDPRTGYPTQPTLAEVTVYAPDCMTADGIATALMVLGVREGMAWVEARPGIEALFVEEGADRTLRRQFSSGFPALQPPQ